MFASCLPDVTHLSILSKQWKYRGEGNANLVIALPQDRVILRLHKTRQDAPISEELEYEEMNRVCREAFFCRTVMVPLLGSAYIQPPTVGRVQHKEIHQLDHLLLPQRPNFRHHKGIRFGYVNIYPDYALLPERLTQQALSASRPTRISSSRGKCSRAVSRDRLHTNDRSLEDVSRLPTTVACILQPMCVLGDLEPVPLQDSPTFCVEIKPKQGWIPHTQMHHTKCTFCLNQYLKLSNGAISRISQYCPLDLFSGDEDRMKKAIKALLRTPQNNLKIFKDGHLLYSDESSDDLTHILEQWLDHPASYINNSSRLIDSFCGLVQHALMTDLLGSSDRPPVDDQFSRDYPCPFICPPFHCPSINGNIMEKLQPCDLTAKPLPDNCILDRILWIQKLQQYDTNTIHHMLWQYRDCDDYDYVTDLRDPEKNQLRMDPVQRYLLATTAKDCSILIAFQRLENSASVASQHMVADVNSGAQYVFNIGVSDLDPKPLSCIEKHRKRDMDIQYICSQPLPCPDQH